MSHGDVTKLSSVGAPPITEALHEILRRNRPIYALLEKARALAPLRYYLGAGCVAQTVWNDRFANDPMYGIEDVDFVYYDASDLSRRAEDDRIREITRALDTSLTLDIKNQARVHLWYAEHFGYEIAPYASLERAIDTWPTMATAVGVRLAERFETYAPFGLEDLFGGTVRANKAQITREIYGAKTEKWKRKWPGLTIIPW
jgi:hypothetical protein